MSQFNLTEYDPKGRKVWYPLPFRPHKLGAKPPAIEVCYAGLTNRPYAEAVAKHGAKTGATRRAARGQISVQAAVDNLAEERKRYAKYVASDMRDVYNTAGEEVKFSHVACLEYMEAWPDYVMQDLATFCSLPDNFLLEDEPTEEEVEAQAGN